MKPSAFCCKQQHHGIAESKPVGKLSWLRLCSAEGKKSNIVIMGEKGRAQLVRVERDRILGTMNDVNKMRITFAQVSFPPSLLQCFLH